MTDREAVLRGRWLYYGGRCWLCGEIADTWDHVKPKKAGGSEHPANLRPACMSCNGQKASSWPINTSTARWLSKRGLVQPTPTHAERMVAHWNREALIANAKLRKLIVVLRSEGASLRHIASLAGTTAPSIQRILRGEITEAA